MVAGNSRSARCRPTGSITAAWWVRPWVSTPPVISGPSCVMLVMSVLAACPSRGRHAPVGRVDKTVTGLLDQAPMRSQPPVRPRAWRSRRRADKSQTGQSATSVRRRVRLISRTTSHIITVRRRRRRRAGGPAAGVDTASRRRQAGRRCAGRSPFGELRGPGVGMPQSRAAAGVVCCLCILVPGRTVWRVGRCPGGQVGAMFGWCSLTRKSPPVAVMGPAELASSDPERKFLHLHVHASGTHPSAYGLLSSVRVTSGAGARAPRKEET
ncbi:hypothetical protein SAMN05192584_12439 [Streptomyces pini]|uniref:Uncharacterized protein n=1 Tax=Streptomyces pini TaxID=1520580 RepID=A0A1I4JQ15_9ACTN|nr:hypothetical protein SAMN05192584_12439 [Streptomyces pini]